MMMFYSHQDCYISYMLELQRAQAVQRRMQACVCRHRRAVRVAQHEKDNFTIALAARRRQFGFVVVERNAARDELQGIHAERDDVIHLVENREAARIRTVFQAARQATKFKRREQELIRQIEELQIDVHRLNNITNPIIPPAPAVEEGPNVLIAEDDGIEMDAEEEPKDEEVEPWEDDHGDGVSDINSNHSQEQLSCSSSELDVLAHYSRSLCNELVCRSHFNDVPLGCYWNYACTTCDNCTV